MILPLISNIIHFLASFRYLLKYYLLCEIYLDALFKIRMHPSISHLLFYSSSSFPQHCLLTNYKIYLLNWNTKSSTIFPGRRHINISLSETNLLGDTIISWHYCNYWEVDTMFLFSNVFMFHPPFPFTTTLVT